MTKALLTPRDVEARHIMSKVMQWQERKAGRLAHIRIGRKVLYREEHIQDYLRRREREAVSDNSATKSAE